QALERTIERVRPGMTEFAICGILEGELRACGSESHPFEPIIAGGERSAEQRELHDVVREANATASGAIRAGMRGKDADALARGYIERRGWGEAFGHSLGHGIGLEVHEAPRLSKAADAPLPVGAVVTIEPGIYRQGWGGIRFEDDVLLTSDGPDVITKFPRELIELG